MEDFKKAVAGQFRIDQAELTEFELYGSGHINETYRVVFKADGRDDVYIFQKINTNVFRNPDFLMENMSRVLKHCEAKLAGRPDQARRCIHLVPTRDGKMFCRTADDNRFALQFRMVTLFDGCKKRIHINMDDLTHSPETLSE